MRDKLKNLTKRLTALWLVPALSLPASFSYAAPMSDYGDAPTTAGFNYGDAYHGDSPLLETLTITGVDHNWQTVSYKQEFHSPVVVCTYQLPSASDLEATVRMRNVDTGSFDIRVQRPRDRVMAITSTVYCLTAEEGAHTLPDGRVFEAHTVSSTATTGRTPGWSSANTEEETSSLVHSYTNPAVLGQVMSHNDSNFSIFWSHNCTSRAQPPLNNGRLCVGKHIAEDNVITTRSDETLGYIVVEAGDGTVDGIDYETALGANTIAGVDNSPPDFYNLLQTYSFAVATLSAINGNNGGWAVLYGNSPFAGSRIDLAIDEDTIRDTERSHTREQVAYWALSDNNGLVARVQPYIGGVPADLESSTQANAAANGDDINDTSSGGVGEDEGGPAGAIGVTFRSPAHTDNSIFADVVVNNPTPLDASLCAWLDVPFGGSVDGVFDGSDAGATNAPGDPQCHTATAGNSTHTFQWSNLPAAQAYTTYARFRVSSYALEAASPTGLSLDGEVEDFKVDFDFRPTSVVINEVVLESMDIDSFLDGLRIADLSEGELLQLLATWDEQRHQELVDTSRVGTVKALRDYLDPDDDGLVAILRWDTLAQQGTLGFYVERSSGDSPWQRINTRLLPALVFAPMGAEYQLADPGARSNQSYRYRLLEQEVQGFIRTYGPYSLEVQGLVGGK